MLKQDKLILQTATLLAIITISLGAFGAHGLKNLVPPDSVQSFETGVRYQMYHVLALVLLGLCGSALSFTTKKWVFRLFLIAIVLFSGSIYLLALKTQLPFEVGFLGPITPIGGFVFLVGWFVLFLGVYRQKGV